LFTEHESFVSVLHHCMQLSSIFMFDFIVVEYLCLKPIHIDMLNLLVFEVSWSREGTKFISIR